MAIALITAAILTGIFVGAFWWLARESGRVHKCLDHLSYRAATLPDDELEDVEVALRVYVAEHCWHRRHVERAREILAFIKGRDA
jgi:hypothetical protein